MSNRALLRVKLSREARSELEQLATNYKSEILFDALNGIGDGDRECEITAEQLRAAAEAHGHVTVSSNIQHGIVYPDSARRAGNQSRPWLVVGVSIFVGACVLIAAKLIPIVIHDEQIQVLITLPIIGIVFLLIGLTILSSEYVWAHRLLSKIRNRFPSVTARLEQATTAAHEWVSKVFHRRRPPTR